MMKDRFSGRAAAYAQYRPHYPTALYEFIFKPVPSMNKALDVGTGNGQVAAVLANYFKEVYATDISPDQLLHAVHKHNIAYSVAPAEKLDFADHQFDLIVAAQAVHWFDLTAFFNEAQRLLKPGGVLAIWGYGLIQTSGTLGDTLRLYYESLSAYWDAERRHIDNAYSTIAFPFTTIETPSFSIDVEWTIEQLLGYLSTWSAAKIYIAKHKLDPLLQIQDAIHEQWGSNDVRSFSFPLFMKMGMRPA
jgi:SAM-dependent methyltransferase